ncbi:MAG: DUF402 domain-containing protein [Anaerolineae bacterium]
MTAIAVEKRNHRSEFVIRYSGERLEYGDNWVCLRAVFERPATSLGFVVFEPGDVFIEWFYADRWYNIFQVHEGDTDAIKGWYCNVTRPAVIDDQLVVSDDLAVDVFITPNGTIILLDEEEFSALNLSSDERMAALRAIQSIRQRVSDRAAPFNRIT